MDHFNSTIKNGKLVSTRRGLQVSRQKFNGISFVNTSAQDPSPTGSDAFTTAEGARAPLRQIKFVEKGNEPRQGREVSFVSDSGKGKKPRRRANPREQRQPSSPGSSSRISSRSPSLTPSGGDARGQHGSFSGAPAHFPIDPRIMGSAVSPPSVWPTQETLSDDEWKLFHHYYSQVPHQSYPHEDILLYNPARGDDFYTMVTSDVAALHCVLMCGTIAEAVVNFETDPKGFAYHISKICSILNRKLDQNQAADAVTLHCIATLAWMGCYVGRLDHWDMHMRGLQKVLDVNGGLGGLPPWLLERIYTADLKGAAALATTTYLPFNRRYDSISAILPADVRKYASKTLSSLLRPLQVDQAIIDVLSSLATFSSAVRLARRSGETVAFEPQLFTEEWQSIMHALITCPGPLREASSDAKSANPYFSGMPGTRHSGGSSRAYTRASSTTENYTTNHHLRPSVPVIPAATKNHFEPAVRIAGLLFLKELLPDWPRNLGGYAVLLSLLRQHLRGIIGRFGTTTTTTTTTTGTLGLDRSRLVQSSSSSSSLSSRPKPVEEDEEEEEEELRPVIVFLAVMGQLSSVFADENEGRASEGGCRYEKGVYGECLRKVCGLAVGQEGDDEDLVMVRLFGLEESLMRLVGKQGPRAREEQQQQQQMDWEDVWGLFQEQDQERDRDRGRYRELEEENGVRRGPSL